MQCGKDIIKCFEKACNNNLAQNVNYRIATDKKPLFELFVEKSEGGRYIRDLLKKTGITHSTTLTGLFLSISALKSPDKNSTFSCKVSNLSGKDCTTLITGYISEEQSRKFLKELLEKTKRKRKLTPYKKNKAEQILEPYKPIKISISYKHDKKELLEMILTSLSEFHEKKLVEFYYDGKIIAGNIKTQIISEIENSQIAIMIITKEYLKSTFIIENEIPKIFDGYKKQKLVPFPILFEKDYTLKEFEEDFKTYCMKLSTEFDIKDLYFTPKDGVPVFGKDWPNVQEAINDIKARLSNLIIGIFRGDYIKLH